jgi:hypothetical protein
MRFSMIVLVPTVCESATSTQGLFSEYDLLIFLLLVGFAGGLAIRILMYY